MSTIIAQGSFSDGLVDYIFYEGGGIALYYCEPMKSSEDIFYEPTYEKVLETARKRGEYMGEIYDAVYKEDMSDCKEPRVIYLDEVDSSYFDSYFFPEIEKASGRKLSDAVKNGKWYTLSLRVIHNGIETVCNDFWHNYHDHYCYVCEKCQKRERICDCPFCEKRRLRKVARKCDCLGHQNYVEKIQKFILFCARKRRLLGWLKSESFSKWFYAPGNSGANLVTRRFKAKTNENIPQLSPSL